MLHIDAAEGARLANQSAVLVPDSRSPEKRATPRSSTVPSLVMVCPLAFVRKQFLRGSAGRSWRGR
jgi:hypothetical protein